jgi:hypothetical protein
VSFEERVKAVATFGFTERQARFLVTVMLHSGVCLLRQYTTFAGIVHGQKTRNFFNKLVGRRLANAYSCRHNRGRVYHVRNKAVYRAIGETDSRYRRPLSAASVVEGLMRLDAVLASPALVWLATAEEKRTHLLSLTNIPEHRLPRGTAASRTSDTARLFPDRDPIGIDLNGRWVVLYVAGGGGEDLRAFVQRHADLLTALPAWTLRLALPPDLKPLDKSFRQVVEHELTTPLSPRAFDELRWYFDQRRASGGDRHKVADEERFACAKEAFAGPRFQLLYARWLSQGDAVFDTLQSRAIGEAIARGAGRIETVVLPHQYRHLSPILGGVARVDGVSVHSKKGPVELGIPSVG